MFLRSSAAKASSSAPATAVAVSKRKSNRRKPAAAADVAPPRKKLRAAPAAPAPVVEEETEDVRDVKEEEEEKEKAHSHAHTHDESEDEEDDDDDDDDDDVSWKASWLKCLTFKDLASTTVCALSKDSNLRTPTAKLCADSGSVLCVTTQALRSVLLDLNRRGFVTIESERAHVEASQQCEYDLVKTYCRCKSPNECWREMTDETKIVKAHRHATEFVVGFVEPKTWPKILAVAQKEGYNAGILGAPKDGKDEVDAKFHAHFCQWRTPTYKFDGNCFCPCTSDRLRAQYAAALNPTLNNWLQSHTLYVAVFDTQPNRDGLLRNILSALK